MSYGVFISYSHDDKDLVTRVVPLVRALRSDLVFQDVDMIPGKPWERQLQGALDEAKMIIVFWCEHSSRSDYVRKEYEKAINQEKDVLPLLLDDSPLSDPLKAYQWVDFREIIKHRKIYERPPTESSMSIEPEPPRRAPTEPYPEVKYLPTPRYGRTAIGNKGARMRLVLICLLAIGIGVLFFYLLGKIVFMKNLPSPWRLIVRISFGLSPLALAAFWFGQRERPAFRSSDVKATNVKVSDGNTPALAFPDDEALELARGILKALDGRVPRLHKNTE